MYINVVVPEWNNRVSETFDGMNDDDELQHIYTSNGRE